MYLLDTNICIYIINNSPKQVVDRVKKLKVHQVKLSSISLAELEYGVSKSSSRGKTRLSILLQLLILCISMIMMRKYMD